MKKRELRANENQCEGRVSSWSHSTSFVLTVGRDVGVGVREALRKNICGDVS